MSQKFGAPKAVGQPFAPQMDYYIPQWEERTSYGMRRIDPYTKLFEDRIIFLGTPISDEIANAVMAQLLCLQQMDADRDIEIYINSPGGSFTALPAGPPGVRRQRPREAMARLSCRSPPRGSRCRARSADATSTGATPA